MNRFNVVQDSLNNRGIQKRLRVLKREAGLLCSKTLPSGEVWTISCCSVDRRKLLLLKRHYYKCGSMSRAKAGENWKIRQFKIAFERSCVVSNFVSGALFPFGQYQEHGFWILGSSKAGRPLITDFQQRQRLQKLTFNATAHEIARVRFLLADQRKCGLWGRDCVHGWVKKKMHEWT